MAARGRTAGFKMSEAHRVKIQNSNILNSLIEHATGKLELSSSQVNAGLGLLKKCLPDLSAVTISGDPNNPLEMNISLDTPTRARALAAFVAKTKVDGK